MTAPLDIDALEAKALAATAGPWWSGECSPADGHALAWLGQSFVDCDGGQKNYATPSRDAEFIAAANPQTILELIRRLREAEADAARYRWLRDEANVGFRTGPQVCLVDVLDRQPLQDVLYGSNLNEAIDAAMAKGE